MKKIILVLVVVIGLIDCCCYDDESTEIIIKVQYSGDFYVFIYNRTIEGEGLVYGIENNNSIKIRENELVPLIGELNYIEILIILKLSLVKD